MRKAQGKGVRFIFRKLNLTPFVVIGTIVDSSGIRIRTVGEGVNFTLRLAFLNSALGEIVFDGLNIMKRNGFVDTFGNN